MKLSFVLLLIASFFFTSSYSQTVEKPLDGKRYSIVMYEGKVKDVNEQLTFTDGMMSFLQSTKYGFSTEEYKCKQKNDSTWTFLAVSHSKKNGIMTWEGKVINDQVEGTCIWTRLLENPINYTFKGMQVKE
jgi:hypothetical protein